ncbi:unnamed protein product [Malus baccata var. baccata]
MLSVYCGDEWPRFHNLEGPGRVRDMEELNKGKEEKKKATIKILSIASASTSHVLPKGDGDYENCPRTMETFVSYKCCHTDGPLNAVLFAE